jgi:hypothetical protein
VGRSRAADELIYAYLYANTEGLETFVPPACRSFLRREYTAARPASVSSWAWPSGARFMVGAVPMADASASIFRTSNHASRIGDRAHGLHERGPDVGHVGCGQVCCASHRSRQFMHFHARQGQPTSHVSLTLNGAPIINLSGCSIRSNTALECNGHDGNVSKSTDVSAGASLSHGACAGRAATGEVMQCQMTRLGFGGNSGCGALSCRLTTAMSVICRT